MNISHSEVDYWQSIGAQHICHIIHVIDHLRVVLENNIFQFAGKYYHQPAGTTVRTRPASSYPNIMMSNFEDKLVSLYAYKLLLWRRFTEEIFLIWTHGSDKLSSFITHLYEIHPTIKFTHVMLYNEIPFLDVNGCFSFCLYQCRIILYLKNRNVF